MTEERKKSPADTTSENLKPPRPPSHHRSSSSSSSHSTIWSWVKGMVSIAIMAWVSWQTMETLRGGRFTAAEGVELDIRLVKLEARQDADEAWRDKLVIPPLHFDQKVDGIGDQLTQSKMVMRSIDNRLTRLEVILTDHNEIMTEKIKLMLDKAKSEGKAEHEDRFHRNGEML